MGSCCSSEVNTPINQPRLQPIERSYQRPGHQLDTSARLSPSQLRKKREEFWSTAPAYSGRQEIWDALRAACETDDTTLMHAIITSAGIRLPDGSLHLAYDELGNAYEIPPYCISSSSSHTSSSSKTEMKTSEEHSSSEKHSPKQESIVASVDTICGTPMKVKLLLSTGEKATFDIGTEDTIAKIKLLLEDRYDIKAEQLMVVFLGKPITSTCRVCDLKLKANDTLQVFVFQLPK